MSDKKVFWPVAVYTLVFVVIGFGMNCYILGCGAASSFRCLVAVISSLALVSALFYVIAGFKKDGSDFLKMFFAFFAVLEFLMISESLTIDIADLQSMVVLMRVLNFGGAIILAVSKDLGRTRSLALTGGIAILEFVAMSLVALQFIGVYRHGDILSTVRNMQVTAQACLSQALIMMVFMKYRDKAARGTK